MFTLFAKFGGASPSESIAQCSCASVNTSSRTLSKARGHTIRGVDGQICSIFHQMTDLDNIEEDSGINWLRTRAIEVAVGQAL